MDYDSFFPVHKNNDRCGQELYQLDGVLAALSTVVAYIFFIPAAHIVLRTFVPGIPRGETCVDVEVLLAEETT